jgi:hypothetical protein
MRIVFLDRSTIGPAVSLSKPSFPHDWIEYERTRPDQVVERLKGLEAIGVDEWIVYLMTEGQDETLEAYGSEIIPAVKS